MRSDPRLEAATEERRNGGLGPPDGAGPDPTTEGSAGSHWRSGPLRKVSGAFPRVLTPEETETRIRPLLARIPVTRVVDLTPLDRLGLPVYGAVTPLALDLTTHAGKGLDPTAARVSALMEAIERFSAERPPRGGTCRGTFRDLERARPRPLDPREFNLPDDSRYAPNRELTWVEGDDLITEERVLVPVDLVVSPPSEGVLRAADTNGLAAGNTRLEAVVHALCEVIERDVLSQIEFTSLYAEAGDRRPPFSAVDPATLPPAAAPWVDRVRSRGLEIELYDVTGDIAVPTFGTILIDPDFPSEEGSPLQAFPGWATATRADAALLRSVTEAVQSRLAFIQGARDSFNVTPSGLRPATRLDQLAQLLPHRRRTFSMDHSTCTLDLREDLEFLLGRLSDAGFERVVAVDLTDPELGVPVVRIRVPGLSSFFVNRRRVDWRCLRYLL